MRRVLARLIEALLVIGLAALVVIFALRSWRTAHESETQAEAPITPADRSISAISYGNEDSTLSFALNDNKEWYWTEYPEYPLDRTKVEQLVSDLGSFSPVLVTRTADEDTIDDAGLASPCYTLNVKYSDATSFSLQVGTATDDGSYYMRYSEEEKAGELYLIDKTLVEDMQGGIYDMYQIESLPQLTERLMDFVTIHYVVVKGVGDEAYAEEESVTYTMKEVDGAYHWFCGARNAERDPGVSEMMGSLVKLKLNRCVVWQPIKDSLTLCGLRPWQAKVEIHYRDEDDKKFDYSFSVGTLCGESERYVRMDGQTAIYTMDAETLVPFLIIAGVIEK